MYCISISYKKTPLSIREKFAFSKEEQVEFLSELIHQDQIEGGVILSTCNRSELYFIEKPATLDSIECMLAKRKQLDVENIKKYCLFYQGKKAVRHLFKVTSGLDSMVLGEDEILRQVKEAYLLAKEQGYTNSELNIIFQGAFNCAKLSKSETKLSNIPVSIGTLTANVTDEYLKGQGVVLVIGATGKMGSIVAKDLVSKGYHVIGTSRKRQQPKLLYMQESECMEWIDFESRYGVLSRVSAVVSATTSPHYTLTKEEFLQHTQMTRPYLLVDLAVPCDIDKTLGEQKNIELLDIDYFKTLARENNSIKHKEANKAMDILEECTEEVLKKLSIRHFQEKLVDEEKAPLFLKMSTYLKDVLDSEQLEKVLDRICEKEGM